MGTVPVAASTMQFASVFRAHAWRATEFSYDARPDWHGTMVAGGQGFFPTIAAFAETLPFAADWVWQLRRFVAHVEPDSFLFRVDWRGGVASKVTAYCRFPVEPDDIAFDRAIARIGPTRWDGPRPGAIAAAVGLAGPRGIGFEVDAEGRPDLSVYFRVPAETRVLPPETTEQLLATAGLPSTLAPEVESDLRHLYIGGTVGVLGVDNGTNGSAAALKFNPPNVALETAVEFLAGKGATASRLEDIAGVARALRARWMSYLGVRYGPRGFSGWRAYLSVAPQRFPGVLAPRWSVEPDAIPTLMLPHL